MREKNIAQKNFNFFKPKKTAWLFFYTRVLPTLSVPESENDVVLGVEQRGIERPPARQGAGPPQATGIDADTLDRTLPCCVFRNPNLKIVEKRWTGNGGGW